MSGAVNDRRVTVKTSSGRRLTIELPENAPTVSDISPWMWARLVFRIEKTNGIGKPSNSVSELQVITVEVLSEVLAFLASVDFESLHLRNLYLALRDVSEGHDHPLFQPQRASRPKESSGLKDIKEDSAAAMQVLMENGYKKFEAAKMIAKVLGESGFHLTRDGKRATAKTVAAWRDRFIGREAGDVASGFRSALGIIECKGRLYAHLKTSDPKKKVQRALSVVRQAVKRNLI